MQASQLLYYANVFKEVKLSFDIRLSKEQQPIFPPRCVACGSDAPGGTLRFHKRSVGWSYGEKFSADVPVCGNCRGKVNRQRWLRFSISLGIIGVAIAVWLLIYFQEPSKAEPSGSIFGKVLERLLPGYLRLEGWVGIGIVWVCLFPWALWQIFFPPPFDMTAYADSVDYQFRDAEYAEEFAVLNKAAGKAEQVSSDGEEA